MARIGFFQFAPQKREPVENIKLITQTLANEKYCLVVLPELFLQKYDSFIPLTDSQLLSYLKPLQVLSEKNHLTFLGSLPIKNDKGSTNTSYYIEGDKIQSIGNKIRLYQSEAAIFTQTKDRYKSFNYGDIVICHRICLDVIDPVSINNEMRNGVDILAVSATVTQNFLHQITQVRSWENQIVTIFSNRIGSDQKHHRYLGKSSIFLPDGQTITAKNQQAFVSIDITPEMITQMRNQRKVLGI